MTSLGLRWLCTITFSFISRESKTMNFLKQIFKDIFAIDLVFVLSVTTSIIYGLIKVQDIYDRAIEEKLNVYNQISSQSLMLGNIDKIRLDFDNIPEEVIFMNSKSALIKLEDDGTSKTIIIQCTDSTLPR